MSSNEYEMSQWLKVVAVQLAEAAAAEASGDTWLANHKRGAAKLSQAKADLYKGK